MSEYKVITISRQFGSGGHEIGEKLAARLGIPLYDNQLISMAADELGYTKESVERADESSLDSFMAAYSVTPMSYTNFISTASYMPSLMCDRRPLRRLHPQGQSRSHQCLYLCGERRPDPAHRRTLRSDREESG